MRIFITGATGLIGRRLVIDRLERGDQVVLLSRDARRAAKMFAAEANRNVSVVEGNPKAAGPWQSAVAGCDVVIHLAGAGIADHRWTQAYKKELFDSRVEGTRQIVAAIAAAREGQRPRVLLNCSAIGYYGDTGDREMQEEAPPGDDFLARLGRAWEEQAMHAADIPLGLDDAKVRVVLLRFAIVLDELGGALKQMITPFKLLVGGPLGSGKQWVSWVHWRDAMGLIDLAIENEAVHGPLNVASPQPVRNKDFARALGRELGKPSLLPTPRFALRIALGEMAEAVMSSQRIIPAKALDAGYVFLYPELSKALAALLAKDARPAMANDEPAAPQAPPIHPGPAVLAADEVEHGQRAGRHRRDAPAQSVKLLAIDVDGTLLNTDGSLAAGVVQACRAAERAGCAVVLATARAPRALRTVLQALDIHGPTINYNGALIWNPAESQPLHHEPVPAALARSIVQDVLEIAPEMQVGLDILDRWYINHVDPAFNATTDPEYTPEYVGPLDGFLEEPVTKLNLLGWPEQIQSVLELVRSKYWQSRQVAVFVADPRLLQITHPLVDKGIALQRIARQMSLTRDQVMAIGDGSNDMGMIEWSGFGVAVENAYPAVKQLADVIVPSNDELGVARAIHRYVLNNR